MIEFVSLNQVFPARYKYH